MAGRENCFELPASLAVGGLAEFEHGAVFEFEAARNRAVDAIERQPVAGHLQVARFAECVHAADVVRMVVGEQHAGELAAVGRQFVEQVEQALLFARIWRTRIDDPQLLVADDELLRRRRGRQGRRGQRRQQHAW